MFRVITERDSQFTRRRMYDRKTKYLETRYSTRICHHTDTINQLTGELVNLIIYRNNIRGKKKTEKEK